MLHWFVHHYMGQCMRFSAMWDVRPAKAQISLRIRSLSLHLSKCHIVGNHMSRLTYNYQNLLIASGTSILMYELRSLPDVTQHDNLMYIDRLCVVLMKSTAALKIPNVICHIQNVLGKIKSQT